MKPLPTLTVQSFADRPALLAHVALRVLPLIALVQRIAMAQIFWSSGRTKVDDWFTLNDTARLLFRDEYALPLLPPDMAAWLAAGAEHVLPVLLVLGLWTRLGAAGMLAMTLVIQVFVYPDAWPTHLSWAGLLLPLLCFGGGAWSVDALIRQRRGRVTG